MRIVNYAGSFDPMHEGHVEIVKKAFDALKPDIFYVTPISRSFTKVYTTTYAQRVEMIKLALAPLNNAKIQINYSEQEIPEGYSGYKHINDLKNYNNAEELYIVIGADHLADLGSWDQIEWLTENVIFYVFARRNIKLTQFAQDLIAQNRLIFNYDFDFEVGSYQQRILPTFLNYDVNQYINNNGLYIHQRLQTRMRDDRYKHSLRVAELAKELALIHKPELANKAWLAGLYHDWCKESSDEQILDLIKNTKYEKFVSDFKKINILHGPAAVSVLRYQVYFRDEDILHAIANHTIHLDDNVTILDKLLYCADKLEAKRNHEDLIEIDSIRELVKTDLDKTYEFIKEYQEKKFSNLRSNNE